MISIQSTRVFSGHTRYGDPLMVAFSLTLDASPSTRLDPAAVQCAMEQVGLRIPHNGIETHGHTPVAEVLPLWAGVARALLGGAGHESGFAVVEPQVSGEIRVVLPCQEIDTCAFAGELASDLLRAIHAGRELAAVQAELDEFLDFARERQVDANARLLMQAARARHLPVRWLDQTPFGEPPEDRLIRFGLLQIGHGVSGRIMLGSMPRVADLRFLLQLRDRSALLPMLARAGIPLPDQDWQFPNRNTVSRAKRSADRLGYPVLVRSLVREEFPYRQRALKAFGPLDNAAQVATAFEVAARPVRKVWIEGCPPGARYRFLVIGGSLRAVALSEPPAVIGDGECTVAELIEQSAGAMATREARTAWEDLAQGDADTEFRLQLAGVTRSSTPVEGQRIELRAEGTAWNGGVCADVTDTVSTDIRHLAEHVARTCGLHELAGVDIAIRDPSGAAAAPNCAVLDVRPDPDLLTHARPDHGMPRDVAADLVNALFPPGTNGRIPLISVTGSNGKTTTSRMLAHILRRRFRHVGLATTSGTMVDDEVLREGDTAGVHGAASVLADERTEAAVLETARGGLLTQGTGFDVCDIGICLNLTEDHLGEEGIETLDQMAAVKSEVIRRTRGTAVLNGDDARVLAMRSVTTARDIILVSRTTPGAELVAQHGARAVVVERVGDRDCVVAQDGDTRTEVMPIAAIPATLGGHLGFNVENAAFAIAGAWAMGLPFVAIREAMESFHASYDCNPGRFNIIDWLPFRVVIDYAHNAEGMRMLCRGIQALPTPRRKLILLRTPADARSHEEIREVAREAAGHFDLYVCARRGKSRTDIPGMLRDTLIEQGVPAASVLHIPEAPEAIDEILSRAQPGDLLVMLGGKRTGMIVERLQELAAAREPRLSVEL